MEIDGSESRQVQPPLPPPLVPALPPVLPGSSEPAPPSAPGTPAPPTTAVFATPPARAQGFYQDPYSSFSQYGAQYPEPQVGKICRGQEDSSKGSAQG